MPSQLSFLPVYNAMSMQRGDSTVQYNTLQRLFNPHFPNQPVFRFASFLAFCYRRSSAYRSVRRHNAHCRRVTKKRTHCSLQSLYALFRHASAIRPPRANVITNSLKEIHTHRPLPPIALQTLDALIRRLLTWIKVLAIRLSKRVLISRKSLCLEAWGPYVSNLVAAGPDHSSALSSLFEGGLLAIVERCDGGGDC
jgi:hypothetical protein